MKLYLDDMRTPPDDTWVLANTYAEMCDYLRLNWDSITAVSLDHDLGEQHTGYDVMLNIEHYCHLKGACAPFTIVFHTANPVGRANMQQVVDSINRFETSVWSKMRPGVK